MGALNAATGELVHTLRPRGRTEDILAAVAAFGAVRPEVPKLLVWDNAPSHKPLRVRETALAANITIAFLPCRSPELMPLEDLWRGLKATVAANRCYPTLKELAERASTWMEAMTDDDRRRRQSGDHLVEPGHFPDRPDQLLAEGANLERRIVVGGFLAQRSQGDEIAGPERGIDPLHHRFAPSTLLLRPREVGVISAGQFAVEAGHLILTGGVKP